MNKLAKFIKEYYNHSFDDDGGYTSEDYKTFENKYKNVLKEMGSEIGLDLYEFNKNHYEFSAIMQDKTDNRFYYISISDVRYWDNAWCDSILYRTMAHEQDYRGGSNHFCKLNELKEKLAELKEAK